MGPHSEVSHLFDFALKHQRVRSQARSIVGVFLSIPSFFSTDLDDTDGGEHTQRVINSSFQVRTLKSRESLPQGLHPDPC